MSVRFIRNLSLVALLLVVSASTAFAQTYWFESYENAVDMIEGQEREEMEEALRTGITLEQLPDGAVS